MLMLFADDVGVVPKRSGFLRFLADLRSDFGAGLLRLFWFHGVDSVEDGHGTFELGSTGT